MADSFQVFLSVSIALFNRLSRNGSDNPINKQKYSHVFVNFEVKIFGVSHFKWMNLLTLQSTLRIELLNERNNV